MAKIVDKSQERYVDVVNRSNGTVSYRLPEINVYRLFQKNEKKHISEEELRSLLDTMIEQKVTPTCPHGRPLVVSISHREMDKKFKRIQN